MATKVKPCRIQATGTPQVGYVPKYVDEDTFQWGAGGAGSGDVIGPASSTDGDVALFDGATGKLIKDSGASLADYQEKLTAGTNIQISNNVISATGGSDIVYATQAEYNALLPGAASDGKHYFIYSTSGGGGWQPGANTLAYYDFENDIGTTTVNQASTGSTYDGTYYATPTYGTLSSGKKYFNCGGSNYSVISSLPINYGSVTFFTWLCRPSFEYKIAFGVSWFEPNGNSIICVDDSNLVNDLCIGEKSYCFDSGKITTTGWHNIIMTNDGTNAKLYVDGTLADTKTGSSGTFNQQFVIGNCAIGNNPSDIRGNLGFNGYFGALGFEDVVWDATAAADYFDQTKATYGIS